MITPPSLSNYSRLVIQMRQNDSLHRRIKLALADNLRFYVPSELEFRSFHSLFVVAGAMELSFIVWRNLEGDSVNGVTVIASQLLEAYSGDWH
jgi:hypothetical protein